MKRLLITLSMLLTLSGCATVNDAWDYFDMARFDNNEYMLANKVRTQANIGARKCGTPEISREVTRLWETTQELRNYSESIPRNEETVTMTSELGEIVYKLDKRYREKGTSGVSMAYCTSKFGNIEKNATIITNVVGNKPR